MKKFLILAAIAITNVVVAYDNSSYMESQQSQSKSGASDYASIMDSFHKKQYDDGTNFIISIVPAAVQPDFAMAYFTDIKLADTSGGVDGLEKADIDFHRQRLPADFRFGITGQFSYLLPTDSYLDLFYNYYGISSSASNQIKEGTTDYSILDFSNLTFGGSAGLSGQYHFGEFYFRTRIAILNFLDKYFHNDVSFGFSFQNINLHHHNHLKNIHFELGQANTDDGLTTADLSLNTRQKHKVFGFGPSFKWLTALDLLPMSVRPHNLSFISEVKFALLYAKYYGKGTGSLGGLMATTGSTAGNDGSENIDFDAGWRSPSSYFVTLNTNLKAGLKYTYKDFSMEFAYKILYFADEDYNVGDFIRGTVAEGVIPDLSQFLNVFPTTIGFRALEVALDYKF